MSSSHYYQPQRSETKYGLRYNLLPRNFNIVSLALSCSLSIIGVASIVSGIVFITRARVFTYFAVNGSNIWAGAIYLLAGSLGIASYACPLNNHLMHSYLAFNIFGILAAALHFFNCLTSIIAVPIASWPSIVSLVAAIVAGSASVTCIAILISKVYCSSSYHGDSSQEIPIVRDA